MITKTNPYQTTNSPMPILSTEARMLLSAVKKRLNNSYYSEVFIFDKRAMRLAGLALDEVKTAQRELMQYPLDLIEYGRLELKTVNGGCQYKLTAV